MGDNKRTSETLSDAGVSAVEKALDDALFSGDAYSDGGAALDRDIMLADSVSDLDFKIDDYDLDDRAAGNRSSFSDNSDSGLRPQSKFQTPEHVANDPGRNLSTLVDVSAPASVLPTVVGLMGSVFWVALAVPVVGALVGGDALSLIFSGQLFSSLALRAIAGIVAGVGLPLTIIWSLVYMYRRLDHVTYSSRLMVTAAGQLMRPEREAQDSIETIADAVRREVTVISDGIDRALNRAGELEILVQNEVQALERSYNDNEIRIRNLIDDLVTQRETIVNYAEQLRGSISASQSSLEVYLDDAEKSISMHLAKISDDISHTLIERGDKITENIQLANDILIQSLDERGLKIVSDITDAGVAINKGIAETGESVSGRIDMRAEDITGTFKTVGADLLSSLETRSDYLLNSLETLGSTLSQSLEQKARFVQDSIADTGTELLTQLDDNLRAVNAHFSQTTEQVVGQLRDNTETIVSRVSQAQDQVVGSITSVGRDVVDTLESRGQDYTQALLSASETLVTTLSENSDTVRSALANAGVDVITSLETQTNDVTSKLESVRADVVRSIDGVGGDVLQSLEDKTRQFSETVDVTVASALNELEAQQHIFTGALDSASAHISDNIVLKSNDLIMRLQDTGNIIADSVAMQRDALTQSLDDAVVKIMSDFGNKGLEVTERMEQLSQTSLSSYKDRSEDILSAIEMVGQDIVGGVAKQSDALIEALEAAQGSVQDQFKAEMQDLSHALANISQETCERIVEINKDVSRAVSSHADTVQKTLAEQSDGIVSTLLESGGAITGAFDDRLNTLRLMINTQGQELVKSLQDRSQAIEFLLTNQLDQFDETVLEKAEGVRLALDTVARETVQTLDNLSINFSDGIIQRLESVEHAFDKTQQSYSAIEERIQHTSQSISEYLAKESGNLDKILGKRANDIRVSLDDNLSQIEQSMGDAAKRANDVISHRVIALTGALETAETRFQQTAEQTESALSTMLDARSQKMTELMRSVQVTLSEEVSDTLSQFSEKTQSLIDGLRDNVEALSHSYITVSEELDSRFDDNTGRLINKIKDKLALYEATLTDRSEKLAGILDEYGLKASRLITSHTEGATSSLRQEVTDLSQVLGTQLSTFQRDLADQTRALTLLLEDTAPDLLQKITTASGEAKDSIHVAHDKIRHDIQSALSELSSTVLGQSQDMAELLVNTTNTLKRSFEDRQAETTSLVQDAEVQMRRVFDQLSESLGSRVKEVEGVKSGLDRSLELLTGELTARVNALESVTTRADGATLALVQQLGEDTQALQSVVATVRDDIQNNVGAFKAEVGSLAEVISQLNANSDDLGTTLEQRRDHLNQLARQLASTTQDVEQRFGQISNHLETTFKHAAKQLETTVSGLPVVSQKAVDQMSQQFERLKLAADDESVRAAEIIRHAYDKISSDVSGDIQKTLDAFKTTGLTIKTIVNDVQSHLAQVEADIRSGLERLPYEATVNTQDLQNSLKEQLSVLSELSDITGRYHKSREAMPTDVRQVQRQETVSGSTKTDLSDADQPSVAPVVQVDSPSDSVRENQRALEAALAQIEDAADRVKQSSVDDSLAVQQSAQVQAHQGVPQSRDTHSNAFEPATDDTGNWLKELLKRASDEGETVRRQSEARPAARQQVSPVQDSPMSQRLTRSGQASGQKADTTASINSLTAELIAELSDVDVIAYWNALKRGERPNLADLFSSERSAVQFDSLKARYHADSGFKTSVDKYTSDFDKLLSDISKIDASQSLTQTYLASNTGKVYTVLCAISSRV